jgi:hypothetical protein
MLLNVFARLFCKRCPYCKRDVHEHSRHAVHRLGRWYCSETHADLYELELYEALRTTHCRHAGCHGEHVLLPEVLGSDCSPGHIRELV